MAESLYLKGKLSIMPSADPAALTTLVATENGDYTPPSGFDGFSDVSVAVPPIPAQLTGLTVTSNGDYTPPAGYDGFDEINVNVPQSAARLTTLSATANGDYTPPAGYDGFNEVNVNVPGSVIDPTTIEIDSNGEVTFTAGPGVDGYNPITVRTNVPNDFYVAAENLNIGNTSVYVTVSLDRVVAAGDKYVISVLDYNQINDNIITIDFNNPVTIPLVNGAYGEVNFTATTINLFNYGGEYRNIYIRLTKLPDGLEVPNE